MIRPSLLACLGALLPLACLAQTPAPPATPAPAAAVAATPVPAAPAPVAPGAPKITYSACHVDGQFIAMTFDDGPHAQNTPRLLDMLKERGIHATFFLVGENAAQYPQIIKRIVAEGHELGNHSWSHPQLSKLGDESVQSQLQKTQDAIVAACGVTPKLMRPPYGAFTPTQQKWCHGVFGYKCILWDVDPEDWKYRNAAHVEAEILKHTVAGSIILSHDIHKTTVDAMPPTLDALLAKGYKFVTVSELIAKDHPVAPKPKATPAAGTAPAPAGEAKPAAKPAATKPAPAAKSAAKRTKLAQLADAQ